MGAEAFAIIGALSFAIGGIVTRRAVIKVPDATVGTLITVPLGVPFFLLVLLATGQIGSIIGFSWQGYFWLSLAGIIHFIAGRSLYYNCVQLAGANIATILQRVTPLVSATLGITLLSEPLTSKLVAGVLLLVIGVTVTGLNPQLFRRGQAVFSGISGKAFLLGTGAGVFWGISPILIKVGLGDSGSPVAGALISYSAAAIILSISLWNQNRRTALASVKSGGVITAFIFVGLFSAIAQLMRYVALGMAPASVVSPLFSISPVFLLVLSFLFNRKLEIFNKAVIIGTVAVVIGTLLLI